VIAAAVLPYARTARFGFVWDDAFVVGPHLRVTGTGDLARLWRTPYDAPLRSAELRRTYFRPTVLASLAFDYAIHRDAPSGYHVTNVALYGIACLFLWLFAWELSGRPVASAAGAALFALHPTHPESVAFVSGRTDVLAAGFLFASLWSAIRWGPRIRSPWLKLVPASALLLLAMGAKEVAVFAAPLLPLSLWVRARSVRAGEALRASWAVAAAALVYVTARSAVLGGGSALPPVGLVAGALPQAFTSVALVARYIPLLLAPVALSARHEFAPREHPDLLFAAGVLVLAALFLGGIALVRRRSPWSVPLALFALTLLPLCAVRLLYGTILAERFLFVPSAAIAPVVALLPGLRSRGGRRAGHLRPEPGSGDASAGLLAGCALAAALLLLLLPARVAVWKDDGALYASMVRDAPRSAYAHAVLAGYLRDRADYAGAAARYREALALEPSFPEPLLDLADTEMRLGQIDSAAVHLRLLTRLRPANAGAWYTLGNLFVGLDRPDSALRAYGTALKLNPDLAEAENNLGAVLERMGRVREAVVHFRRALTIAPENAEAARNLARLGAASDGAARSGR
jgi:protein O-mannosyl-transferase